MKQTFALDSIVIEKRFQPRVKGVDESHVADLMTAYGQADADIEPPRVWTINGIGTVLTRGFHRVEALRRLGRKRVECEVKAGTVADALTDAAASNVGHGLKRSNADKRRSVEMVLEAHPDWSNKRVSEEAGVDDKLVADVRESRTSDEESPGKREDSLGRKQPAKKPRKAKSAPETQPDDGIEPPGEPEPAKPAGITPETITGRITPVKGFPEPTIQRFKRDGRIVEKVIDMTGNPIPDCMGDLFVDNTLRDVLSAIEDGADLIDKADAELLKYSSSKITTESFAWVDFAELNGLMKKFRDAAVGIASVIRDGLPFAVCPHCHGDKNGCKKCRLCGYWPRPEVHGHPALFRKNAGAAA